MPCAASRESGCALGSRVRISSRASARSSALLECSICTKPARAARPVASVARLDQMPSSASLQCECRTQDGVFIEVRASGLTDPALPLLLRRRGRSRRQHRPQASATNLLQLSDALGSESKCLHCNNKLRPSISRVRLCSACNSGSTPAASTKVRPRRGSRAASRQWCHHPSPAGGALNRNKTSSSHPAALLAARSLLQLERTCQPSDQLR